MQPARSLIPSVPAAYCCYAFVLCFSIIFAVLSSDYNLTLKPIPTRDYNKHQCLTGNTSSQETLKILDLFVLNTDELAEHLCLNKIVKRHYKSVEVSWIQRDQFDLRRIFNLEYDLLFTKPELLLRIEPKEMTSYVPIASHTDYLSQLISLSSVPELTTEYFKGKRLGLIDDPNSLSGYQIPRSALFRHKVDESAYSVQSYKSHHDLHYALYSHQVDIIASFSSLNRDVGSLPKTYQLDIGTPLPGPKWYLHPALIDQAIHCGISQELAWFSKNSSSPYIKDLSIVRDCQPHE